MSFTWAQILAHWRLIDADLHQFYRVDTATGVLSERSADWLRNRIEGLLGRDSRLSAALTPESPRRS